ncbi:MAG: hypothetical protein LBD34_04140 [Puniceicoccales bacterium]|jgi:hypothetical protein|nr:hypothetical protein [Puniceicoccales bacterium]
MEVKPENIDPAARTANTNPADTKSKSLFDGRTLGARAGNKTFMTKEVMSALDKKGSTSETEDTPTKE